MIQITLELWGAFFGMICLAVVFFESRNDSKRSKALITMLLFCCILQISDAVAYMTRGTVTPLGYYLVRVSNFVVFWSIPALSAATLEYILACANETGKVKWVARSAIYLIVAVYTIILIFSLFTGLIYYFDEDNIYHRAQYYWISAVFAVVMLINLIVATTALWNNLLQFERWSLITFVVLPAVSNLFQLFHYGISLNNVAIEISVLMIFAAYEIDKNKYFHQQELLFWEQKITIAEQKAQLAVSQIQPHFLFNVLGSIEQLCRVNPAKAETATHQFARFMRSCLIASGKRPVVRFTEEMQILRSYIWLEKMRFDEDIQFSEEISVDTFELPHLSVQPLVENAIKHGMRQDEDVPIHITVRTMETPDYYMVIVKDDGTGFDPEQIENDGQNHFGLSNVRSRIELLMHGMVSVQSKIGEGTSVTIWLPKYRAEQKGGRIS